MLRRFLVTTLLLTVTAPSRAIDTVKLSPQIRVTPLTDIIPTVGITAIAPFLTKPLITDNDDLKQAAYVVGFPDEHLVVGVHDAVYVRQITATTPLNFHILRPGEALRDPASGEILGYEAQMVAEAVLERTGDPAKLQIIRAEREVAVGDRVVPAPDDKQLTDFYRRPAPAHTEGLILAVLNGVAQIGQFDVVVINRGSRERIVPGHVFEAFIGGDSAHDPVRDGSINPNWRGESPATTEFWYGRDMERRGWKDEPFPLHAIFERKHAEFTRPLEHAATLMVFRTFKRVSLALVLDAERAFEVGAQIAPAAQ
jgi:hypothetical protein